LAEAQGLPWEGRRRRAACPERTENALDQGPIGGFIPLMLSSETDIYPSKPMNTSHRHLLAVTTGIAFLTGVAQAATPTAFELAKKGGQYVGSEAKGRVIQIRSEKSIASLTPNIWYVLYFDPNASAKATEVKFEAGEKTEVKYKDNFLGLGKKPKELPKDKLRVDSDRALQTAVSEPLLKNLTLKATRMTLEDWQGIPAWRVQIWAAKLQKAEEMVEVGEVFIGAEEGKVLRSDLKIKRVD
jgi:hypothetical protein